MSGTPPVIHTSAFTNTNTRQSGGILSNTAYILKTDLVDKQFSVLKKCRSKFDCLIFEMFFIKELSPKLNTQKDSIRAKNLT